MCAVLSTPHLPVSGMSPSDLPPPRGSAMASLSSITATLELGRAGAGSQALRKHSQLRFLCRSSGAKQFAFGVGSGDAWWRLLGWQKRLTCAFVGLF